ncbi:hypothetical protein OKW96_19845 [Sphingobacterium sp. KU25419]|nr:hypothetical protein OKW96_19845 [Sphingobacterium sp. KU25419]
MIKHVVIRILALIILLFIAIPIAMAQLDPRRRCGTGDIGVILFFMGIFYLIWMIYLLAESFSYIESMKLQNSSSMLSLL